MSFLLIRTAHSMHPLQWSAAACMQQLDTLCSLNDLSQHRAQRPPAPAGRFGLYGWLRMLVVSYFSNLLGALLLVSCLR